MIDYIDIVMSFFIVSSVFIVWILRAKKVLKSARLSLIIFSLPGIYYAFAWISLGPQAIEFYCYTSALFSPTNFLAPLVFIYQIRRYVIERRRGIISYKASIWQKLCIILLFGFYATTQFVVYIMYYVPDS